MGQSIQIRRGQEANLPSLQNGEMGLTVDTGNVFIGTPAGNQLVGGNNVVERFPIASSLFHKRETDRDDTERLQRLIDHCHTTQQALVLDGGTYYVVSLELPEGFVLNGNGSTFKKPKLLEAPYHFTVDQAKRTRMINFYHSGDVDSLPTTIQNLTLDGSAWDMWDEPSYDQEQASLIFCMADSTKAGKAKISIQNCHFQDNVSDGIHLFTNVDANISNCSSTDCFRGGLTITGGNTKVNASNFHFKSVTLEDGIDVEMSEAGYDGQYGQELNFSNFTLEAKLDIQLDSGSVLNLDNISISQEKGDWTLGVGFDSVIYASNCVFVNEKSSNNDSRLLLMGEAHFHNCSFLLRNTEPSMDYACFHIYPYDQDEPHQKGKAWFVEFTHCRFAYIGGEPTHIPIGVTTNVSDNVHLVLDRCYFDSTLHYGADVQVNRLDAVNCRFNAQNVGILWNSNSYNPSNHLAINGVQVMNETVEYLYVNGQDADILHENIFLTEQTNKLGGDIANSTFKGSRTIYVDHVPSETPVVQGLKGDKAINGISLWTYDNGWKELSSANVIQTYNETEQAMDFKWEGGA
jgi:hypothetical protein